MIIENCRLGIVYTMLWIELGKSETQAHEFFILDPTSRMQKLMSRIRKQQEEWTKQKANRETQVSSNVDSQDENGMFIFLLFLFLAFE